MDSILDPPFDQMPFFIMEHIKLSLDLARYLLDPSGSEQHPYLPSYLISRHVVLLQNRKDNRQDQLKDSFSERRSADQNGPDRQDYEMFDIEKK